LPTHDNSCHVYSAEIMDKNHSNKRLSPYLGSGSLSFCLARLILDGVTEGAIWMG